MAEDWLVKQSLWSDVGFQYFSVFCFFFNLYSCCLLPFLKYNLSPCCNTQTQTEKKKNRQASVYIVSVSETAQQKHDPEYKGSGGKPQHFYVVDFSSNVAYSRL